VGFVVAEVVLGWLFSEYFGFPCQFSLQRLLHTHHHHHHHYHIIQGWYNSGRHTKWSRSQPTQEITVKKHIRGSAKLQKFEHNIYSPLEKTTAILVKWSEFGKKTAVRVPVITVTPKIISY
jgi:hypothetical protein